MSATYDARLKILDFLQENYNYDSIEDMVKDAKLLDNFVTGPFQDTVPGPDTSNQQTLTPLHK